MTNCQNRRSASADGGRVVLWSIALLLGHESSFSARGAEPAGPLPGTTLLEMQGDIASQLVDGVDRFLDGQARSAVASRRENFKPDTSSVEAYLASIEPKRKRLAKLLGVVDPLHPFDGFHFVTSTARSGIVRETQKQRVRAVRWPVLRGVWGEGLLIESTDRPPKGGLVFIPHAGETPESVLDLNGDLPGEVLVLASAGYRVLIPTIIDYGTTFSTMPNQNAPTGLTHREFCYRPAFEMGRHILGYEVQKVIAGVRGLRAEGRQIAADFPVVVRGRGEGALIGLFAGALSNEIDMVALQGRDLFVLPTFLQPINRNVFGLHQEFGLAELAMLITPSKCYLSSDPFPSIPYLKAGGRGAPVPGLQKDYPDTPEGKAQREKDLMEIYAGYVRSRPIEDETKRWKEVVAPLDRREVPRLEGTFSDLLERIQAKASNSLLDLGTVTIPYQPDERYQQERMRRQIDEVVADTQYLLEESPSIRESFWEKARPAREARSADEWARATQSYREYFSREVIGQFDLPKLPTHPRTRIAFDEASYTGYEVVLDVFPEVIAYGLLLVPKGIPEGERRPVVVAQHGLEGRPQDLADPKINNPAYNQFGCRLAERGFMVFAPQNLYIFEDRFRVLQRKLNPLGKTLFSVIIPQHEQILAWLSSLPFVDAQRIGFYGLSYGGKSAMRIPAVIQQYALSICSADFNDWIWKNASTRSPYSYVWSPEYEIFEFDLGMTFNYAEMAGLIAPRPFMVERGHHDGVAPDDRVAAEYAKVKRLYVDLRIPERSEIEFFDGPHTVHGVGTFRFLHQHLRWPSPAEPTPLEKTAGP